MDSETERQLNDALGLVYYLDLAIDCESTERSLHDIFTAVRENSDHSTAYAAVAPCINAIFTIAEREIAKRIEKGYTQTANKFGIEITDADAVTEWAEDIARTFIAEDEPQWIRDSLNSIIAKSALKAVADLIGKEIHYIND